jgi:hypothetical protein
MSKYTNAEKILVRSKVATLTIKRIPDPEIIKEIFRQTNKTISRSGLYNIRQQIKRDSYNDLLAFFSTFLNQFPENLSQITRVVSSFNHIFYLGILFKCSDKTELFCPYQSS